MCHCSSIHISPSAIPYTGEVPARCLRRTGPQPCISLNFPEVGEEKCHTHAVFISRTNCYSLSWESDQVNSQNNHSRKKRQKVRKCADPGEKWSCASGEYQRESPQYFAAQVPGSRTAHPWCWVSVGSFLHHHMSKSPLSELAWVRSKANRYNIIKRSHSDSRNNKNEFWVMQVCKVQGNIFLWIIKSRN